MALMSAEEEGITIMATAEDFGTTAVFGPDYEFLFLNRHHRDARLAGSVSS